MCAAGTRRIPHEDRHRSPLAKPEAIPLFREWPLIVFGEGTQDLEARMDKSAQEINPAHQSNIHLTTPQRISGLSSSHRRGAASGRHRRDGSTDP
tara:strand:+ start:480 stop:764 length:285 start_codon:yes stop_codon:yes gene_type:complete